MLYSNADLERNPMTIDKLTKELYPGLTYDTAFPESWFREMLLHGFDPRGQVVWAYPAGTVFGMAAPLTIEARDQLQRLGQAYYDQDGIHS